MQKISEQILNTKKYFSYNPPPLPNLHEKNGPIILPGERKT